MKHKKSDQRKCKTSPLIITLIISLSVFGVLVFTKDITLIARVTLRWPDPQAIFQGPFNSQSDSTPQTQENRSIILESSSSSSKPIPVRNGESIILESINKNSSAETQTQRERIIPPVFGDEEEEGIELPPKGCDLSKGKWVFDNVTRPLYKEGECVFMTSQLTCTRNGREDTLYQNWRWQPNDCSLPKFKARLLLERLRDKKLLFVGDSVNRNQWESMVCLLNSGIPPGKATWKMGAPLSSFYIQDYNATVEFYWAPFLVESNSDDPRNHSISQRIIMPESISKHGIHWKAADFLVFNTYIWWMNSGNIKVLQVSNKGSVEYDEVERSTAYERVLTTWAKWLKHNIDHTRTATFFISMSPVHQQSSNWNYPDGMACARETTPIMNTSMVLDVGTDRRLLEVATTVIKATGVAVSLLDITTLSEYRKDGHTSVYTIRQGKLLTPEQKADPATFADCLHWCLPGVPDTWNELLYTHIISRS